MGYEVPLREIDPQRAREEASRSVLAFIEGVDQHPAGGPGAVRPALGRRPGPRPGGHPGRPALRASPFVLVATARQAVTERWTVPTGRHNTVLVNLDPLDHGAAGALLDALVEGEVSAEMRAMLLDRSGGNPFFLEELVALVGDADAEPRRRRGRRPGRPARHLARSGGGPPRRADPVRARQPGGRRRVGSQRPDQGPGHDGRALAGHHRLSIRCWSASTTRRSSRSTASTGCSAPISSARWPTAP